MAEKSGNETRCNPARFGGLRMTPFADGARGSRASSVTGGVFDGGRHAPISVAHAETATATHTNPCRVTAPCVCLASERSICKLRLQATLRHRHRDNACVTFADLFSRRGRRGLVA